MAEAKEVKPEPVDERVEMFNAIASLPEAENRAKTVKLIDDRIGSIRTNMAQGKVMLIGCLTDGFIQEALMPDYNDRSRLAELVQEVQARYNALKEAPPEREMLAGAYKDTVGPWQPQ